MASSYISAGNAILKERPYLEEKFDGLIGGNITTGEANLKGIATDIRLDCLWVAGDTNKLLYRISNTDCSIQATYPYPEDIVTCHGIVIEYENDSSNIMMLGRDTDSKLKFVRLESTLDVNKLELEVKNSYYVQSDTTIVWNDNYTGLTRKGYRYFAIGGQQGEAVYELNRTGQLRMKYTYSSTYASGIAYANSRFYLGMKSTGSASGFLDKYGLDFENRSTLEGIEPFMFNNFTGDIDTDKDVMWAVSGAKLYKYSIVYYAYIIDGVAYDEIDLGVIKAGGEEITKITFKNISDSFVLEDVTLSIVPDADSDAEDYLNISSSLTDAVWGTALARTGVVGIDGEFDFYLRAKPPEELTQEGNPRVAKINVACKMY